MSRVAMFHACEVYCCCNELDYGVRIESVSSGLRLWSGRNQVAAGDTCGPSVSVEGTATNDNAYVTYSVLDGDGKTIRTITRHFRVAIEATITLDVMTCGGGALVVKRPTDPARFNSATGTVCVTGAAASCLMLEGDKVCFEQSGASRQTVNCDETGTQFIFYGVTPSETMNDASITLKTIGGETLVATNLTVLWVDISMRCGQGDSLSPDNVLLAQYASNVLGPCQMITNVTISGSSIRLADAMGNGAEFVGQVRPSNFTDMITLSRSIVGSYIGHSSLSTSVMTDKCDIMPWPGDLSPNDLGPEECRDDNPAPNGYVYDVDTPGINIDAQAIDPGIMPGTVLYIRDNFVEYAMFENTRCSNDFPWHNRGTFQKTGQAGVVRYEFFNRPDHSLDNAIGPAHTNLSAE